MGLIGQIFGMGGAAKQIGEAVGGVAEVIVGNRAERDGLTFDIRQSNLALLIPERRLGLKPNNQSIRFTKVRQVGTSIAIEVANG